jgi:hypothetical protein
VLAAQFEDLDACDADAREGAFADQLPQELEVDEIAEAVVVAAVCVDLGAGVDLLRDLVAHRYARDPLGPLELDGIQRAGGDAVHLLS